MNSTAKSNECADVIHKAQGGDPNLSTPTVQTHELPSTLEQIHQRAQNVYVARGGAGGIPLNDWLKAEQDPKRSFKMQVAPNLPPSRGRQQPNVNVAKLNFGRDPQHSTDSVSSNKRSTPSDQLVGKLAGASVFREFRQAFEGATGLPLMLRAAESWQLAHRGSRHQNGFCALMSQTNRSCAACLQMQQRVCKGVNGVPCTMSCEFGITETAVAVKIGQQIVAYLQTGQVFFAPPKQQKTRHALEQIKAWGLDIDLDNAARQYNETPVFRRCEYQACVRLLQFFANQLGATANQIVLQQQTAEPEQITRARRYIEAHYHEDLSLAGVARPVGMSTFYFCKKFKQVTGVNFTHYVSRIRVENAKNLLPNRNYRITEIAFQVGFKSLTHFNRKFRDATGCSPTEFRRNLPTA